MRFPAHLPVLSRVSVGRGEAVAARSSNLVYSVYFNRCVVGLAVWYMTVDLLVGDVM